MLDAGVVLSATDALRGDQQTFDRAQVAVLISLAYETGRIHGWAEDMAETAACWEEFASPKVTREQRKAARLAQMDAGAQRQRHLNQARKARLKTLDVEWPPVAVPGRVE